MKRKYSSCSEEESTDETWEPEGSDDDEVVAEPRPVIQTRSSGPAVKPADTSSIDAAMDAVDKVVDDESDLSSDTEEDDEEDDEESGEEEEEEDEDSEEDDYSDDDSFVTSNEDADNTEERDEAVASYSRVFDGDDECELDPYEEAEPRDVAEEDLSIGGYLVGSGEM